MSASARARRKPRRAKRTPAEGLRSSYVSMRKMTGRPLACVAGAPAAVFF